MDEKSCYIIRGIVVDGLGEGAKYVRMYSHVIREVLGIVPYPGTLNIKLWEGEKEKMETFIRSAKQVFIIPPAGEGLCRGYAWKAYLRIGESTCIPVYIVRPEKTAHGGDIVEILSEVYIRGSFAVRSGDVVEILVGRGCFSACLEMQ